MDPENLSGESPQSGEYRCAELTTGAESCYLLLPRTEVDKTVDVIGSINSIDILKNQKISVMIRISHLYFEFNKDLSLHSINISHIFKQKYDRVTKTTTEMSELQEKMRKELLDQIMCFDGKDWVNRPARLYPLRHRR